MSGCQNSLSQMLRTYTGVGGDPGGSKKGQTMSDGDHKEVPHRQGSVLSILVPMWFVCFECHSVLFLSMTFEITYVMVTILIFVNQD